MASEHPGTARMNLGRENSNSGLSHMPRDDLYCGAGVLGSHKHHVCTDQKSNQMQCFSSHIRAISSTTLDRPRCDEGAAELLKHPSAALHGYPPSLQAINYFTFLLPPPLHRAGTHGSDGWYLLAGKWTDAPQKS